MKPSARRTEPTEALHAVKNTIDAIARPFSLLADEAKLEISCGQLTVYLFPPELIKEYPDEIATQLCLSYLHNGRMDSSYLSMLLVASQTSRSNCADSTGGYSVELRDVTAEMLDDWMADQATAVGRAHFANTSFFLVRAVRLAMLRSIGKQFTAADFSGCFERRITAMRKICNIEHVPELTAKVKQGHLTGLSDFWNAAHESRVTMYFWIRSAKTGDGNLQHVHTLMDGAYMTHIRLILEERGGEEGVVILNPIFSKELERLVTFLREYMTQRPEEFGYLRLAYRGCLPAAKDFLSSRQSLSHLLPQNPQRSATMWQRW